MSFRTYIFDGRFSGYHVGHLSGLFTQESFPLIKGFALNFLSNEGEQDLIGALYSLPESSTVHLNMITQARSSPLYSSTFVLSRDLFSHDLPFTGSYGHSPVVDFASFDSNETLESFLEYHHVSLGDVHLGLREIVGYSSSSRWS